MEISIYVQYSINSEGKREDDGFVLFNDNYIIYV